MGAYSNDKVLEKKILAFIPSAEAMPAVVIIHQLEPFGSIYMNEAGLEKLGLTLEDLREIGEDYHKRFFNFDDAEEFLNRMKRIIDYKDPKESFTFIQQVKIKESEDWVWHIGSTRNFSRMWKEKLLTW